MEEAPEIIELQNDLRFGNRDAKLRALDRLRELRPASERVKVAIREVMTEGDGAVQLSGARALVAVGEESDTVVQVLLSALELPLMERREAIQAGGRALDEFIGTLLAKQLAVESLSYLRTRPEVVEALLRTAQYAQSPLDRDALCALGAIGSPAAREFIEYQSRRGNRAAETVLKLFGKADFEMIKMVVQGGDSVRRCQRCGWVGQREKMQKTLLGKYKCPSCGAAGGDVAFLAGLS